MTPIRLPLNVHINELSKIAIHDYDDDGDLDLFIRDDRRLLYCSNTGSGQFAAPIVLLELSVDLYLGGFTFVNQEISDAPPLLVVEATIRETDESKLLSYRRQVDGTLLKVEEFTLPKVTGDDFINWEFTRSETTSTRAYLSLMGGQFSSNTITSRLYELKCGDAGLSMNFLNTHQGVTDFNYSAEANLNGDAFKDLVVMIPSLEGTGQSASDHILWYPGTSDGSYQETPSTVVSAKYERYLMLADDLEGDGDTDLVFGLGGPLGSFENGSRIALWSNQGNGVNFEKRTFTIPETNPFAYPSVLGIEDFVTSPRSDGDRPTGLPFDLPAGRKDLMILSYKKWPERGAQVHIAFQSAQGIFHAVLVETVDDETTIYYEDWDKDGARDLVYYGGNGAVSWSKRTGYRFGPRQEIMVFPTSDSVNITLLDMDGDGDLDVYGQGSLFGPNTFYWAELGAQNSILSFRRLNTPLNLFYFDVDGDGIENTTVLFGNTGEVNPTVNYRFEMTDLQFFSNGPWGLFDFDADGDLDSLNSAYTDGTRGIQRLIWHENKGGGPRFSDETGLEFAGVELSERNRFAMKDMNGDGTRDLLVVSWDSALVEWFKISNRRGPQVFGDWMAGQNLKGSSAGPMADWDMDRRTNWEEFIFGTQANINDSGYGREPHIETAFGGMQFTYTRRRSGNGLYLDYGMQRSRTLNGDWEPWNPDVTTQPPNGHYETIRIPINPWVNAEFFRLKLPGIPE